MCVGHVRIFFFSFDKSTLASTKVVFYSDIFYPAFVFCTYSLIIELIWPNICFVLTYHIFGGARVKKTIFNIIFYLYLLFYGTVAAFIVYMCIFIKWWSYLLWFIYHVLLFLSSLSNSLQLYDAKRLLEYENRGVCFFSSKSISIWSSSSCWLYSLRENALFWCLLRNTYSERNFHINF